MPITFVNSPFEFIKTDVTKQREIANGVLAQAQAIQELLDSQQDLSNRQV